MPFSFLLPVIQTKLRWGGMATSSPSLSGSLGNRSGINNSED